MGEHVECGGAVRTCVWNGALVAVCDGCGSMWITPMRRCGPGPAETMAEVGYYRAFREMRPDWFATEGTTTPPAGPEA